MGTDPPKEARETAAFEAKGGQNVGNSILHITTAGLVLMSLRHGLIFDIGWGSFYTATQVGKREIMLSWDDGDGHHASYTMSFGDPSPVMHELKATNDSYASQVTFIDALRSMHATSPVQADGTRTDFGDNEDMWHETQAVEGFGTIAPSRVPIIAPRDPRVPLKIPDIHVWNDAWYDGDEGCFVTNNAIFCRVGEDSEAAARGMYASRRPDGSVTIDAGEVQFAHGYPAVMREWNGEGGMRGAWTLLPTIRAEMLTVEMALAKVSLEPNAQHVTYLTSPAGVYAPRFHAPVSVHEATLLNSEMRKYAQSAYRGVIECLNYLRENVQTEGAQGSTHGAMRLHDAQDAHEDPNFRKWMLEPDAQG